MADDRPPDCDYEVGASAALTRAGIFPMRLCCCLPLPLKAMVPATLHVIQDFTHLAMVAGSVSAVLILVKQLYNLMGSKELMNPGHWWEPVLTIVATAPNLAYMMKLLGRYDEQIVVKEKAINEKKKELANSYSNLVQDMDDLLGKAAESSATMAERGFESKRRDFQRFLERADVRYAQVQASFSQSDREQLVVQFRRFVQRWLTVFTECSVDPIGHPKRVVSEEELAQCWTIGEIAGLTLERLKLTEVRFISARCDQDKKLLKGFRAQHRKLTVAELTPLQLKSLQGMATSVQPKQPLEIEMSSSVRSRLPSTVEEEEDSDVEDLREGPSAATSRGGRPTVVAARPAAMLRRWFPCGWLAAGSFGLGCTTGGMPGGWPRSMQCMCAQLILLSQDRSTWP
ncbi:unnamed protein product [Prorocentrum cordatum]|uniref:Uncharacterized protein n=1 Tax=Prorocentrum cordatum TaxID=2364126 RepID=A0ABN9UP18_9DINO|nr:unnamed protein product [Polarella glacialis]